MRKLEIGDVVSYMGDPAELMAEMAGAEQAELGSALARNLFLVTALSADDRIELETRPDEGETRYLYAPRGRLRYVNIYAFGAEIPHDLWEARHVRLTPRIPRDANGREIHVGSFVRILAMPAETLDLPEEEAAIRRGAVGRVGQIARPPEGTSDNNIQTRGGEFLVRYAILTAEGISGYAFPAEPGQIEVVDASEELLLLYSDQIGQMLAPFGEAQTSPTFARLVAAFGYSRLA